MAKPKFTVTMQHDEDSLVLALTFMQYRLGADMGFVLIKAVLLSLLSVFCLMPGLLVMFSGLINRTAHRITDQLKAAGLPFPASEYSFDGVAMHIVSLPEREESEPLPYGKMLQLGEDFKAYYIFRDQYGGYMIPKAALGGREEEFRRFVQEKTGKLFIRRWTPLRRLKSWLKQRENEPEHL